MYGVPKVSELVYTQEPKPSPFLKSLKKPPAPVLPKKEERPPPPKQLLIASHAENCDISVILEDTSSKYQQMFKPEFVKPTPVQLTPIKNAFDGVASSYQFQPAATPLLA